MITRKTKDYWIKILEQNKQLCGTGLNAPINELKIMIAEVESLEVEPTCLFKKGELCLFGNDSTITKYARRFSHINSLGKLGKFVDAHNAKWTTCHHFTEWLPYTGSKPELPAKVKGWHLKFENGRISTYEINFASHLQWNNSNREDKIIEFQYWMEE